MGSFRRLILGMFPERLRKQISDCEKQVHLINNQIEESGASSIAIRPRPVELRQKSTNCGW